jgi:predicted phage terminase large subunit-like protein
MSLRKNAEHLLTEKQAVVAVKCERSHLFFTRWFFKQRQSNFFKVNWHHHFIADTLEKVITGEIKNLVINVPPGSSKTEMAVINFMARGLAKNPWCRFMHLSYSDDLALLNSQVTRDMIRSDEFQELWPMDIADDSKAKKRWNVMVNGKAAGGVYATSLAGQITGFRAGHMAPGFQGAIIIDDPLKPEDAFSEPKLNQANRKLLTTVRSRRANPDTPVILIMQRISEKDPTAFIKQGGLEGMGDFVHIVIPAVIDEAYVASLDAKYQALIERDAPERFSYWPYKEPIAQLLRMEKGEGTDATGARIGRHVFTSQYQQAPKAIGGNIIHGSWFKRHQSDAVPKLVYRKIFVDTAMKTAERNDYSVLECWGKGLDGGAYLIDMIRGKWEAPELEKRTIAFWQKHANIDPDFNSPVPILNRIARERLGQLREMIVEDKSSGTGLIQKIKLLNHIPVKPIERVKDKLTRVMDVVGYLESGLVSVPEDAPFTNDFIAECEGFTADNSHAHDDQIDPMVDAINDMLSTGNRIKVWENLM